MLHALASVMMLTGKLLPGVPSERYFSVELLTDVEARLRVESLLKETHLSFRCNHSSASASWFPIDTSERSRGISVLLCKESPLIPRLSEAEWLWVDFAHHNNCRTEAQQPFDCAVWSRKHFLGGFQLPFSCSHTW